MNWRISSILFLLIVSTGCKKDRVNKSIADKVSYLIEVDELKKIIREPNIKIIDFRKKGIYEKEHVVTAINIWRTDIEDTSYPYNGMMASGSKIELLFGKLGIESSDTLVIYDDEGLCNASRLWWILLNYNFKNVKLLHGGINAWKAIDGQVSSEIPMPKKTNFKLTKKPDMQYYVSKERVQEALKSNTIVLDTRTADEFSGKRQKKGATKGGRIPKSIHIDWAEAINYSGNGLIKPLRDLETIYGKLQITKEDPIILYCHTGVRSAHTTFVLTQLLGYKNVKNYDGSWVEWSYFDDLPFEKDSTTLITE